MIARIPPLGLFFLLIVPFALGQNILSSIPGESKASYEQRLKWWREARFGIFIHWGPVSLKGTEIGWSRGREIPVEVYDNLYKQFNPKKFNPKKWAMLFKRAGAKYVVIVAKHHDGFSMFDSSLTNYDAMNTPAKRDFIGELVKSCRKEKLRVMFYYSLCDWHHPDYREDFKRYLNFVFGQIRELCLKYHPDGIWFDGGWEHTAQEWRSAELINMIHSILPKAIINNRAGLPADYDTPEQEVGAFNSNRAWESCITLGTQWAWKPNDKIKSLKQCLRLLVSCAGGDGNLLLNVGPTPEGEIEERQAKRLEEVGNWLAKYGEGIYGTKGGPFMPGNWGASTHKGNVIYLFVFNFAGDRLELPPIKKKVKKISLLIGGKAIVEQNEKKLLIIVPKKYHSDLITVVKLHLEGSADDITPLPGATLPSIKAKSSNVFQNMPAFGAEKAVDEDETTRWATDFGINSAWLEVDLGEPRRIKGVRILEAVEYGKRVKRFAIECRADENGEWKTVIMGTEIGEKYERRFIPVTARYWRLHIYEASEGPTIYEFQLIE